MLLQCAVLFAQQEQIRIFSSPNDMNQSWNVLQFEESSVMADEFKVVVNGKKGKWFVVTEMDLYASEKN